MIWENRVTSNFWLGDFGGCVMGPVSELESK